ncbi:membrane protein insertion efficiency factor YidD [Fumia xinanensis]|uniref:Putative membrane protein insertion efficiency factor n=1 Tax=Fumia xinanensis TaxID=2763659 RepID=A0A926I7X2_9FIRM|nr:membrane protein insertion efficiency factor YidD [Fumia xinanensis]MBC8560371.1 membrane protein insertion efficiency factor YidD [Fumia xinanensis]
MKKNLLKLIYFYQKYLSKWKGPCCRYYPTCSSYAIQAVERFGAVKGSYLMVKRILRCNPLFKGGIDPVPETFSLFTHRKDK